MESFPRSMKWEASAVLLMMFTSLVYICITVSWGGLYCTLILKLTKVFNDREKLLSFCRECLSQNKGH